MAAPSGAGDREGFGTLLLTEAVPMQLGGTAVRTIGPEGLRCRLTLPAGALA
jgi:two-component sensor histidine kinase